jgi:hypothetical protein
MPPQVSPPDDRQLVLRIDAFISLETSDDQTSSVITGRTISGKTFHAKAIWGSGSLAPAYIKRRMSEPKADRDHCVLAGRATGTDPIVLNVDTFTARGSGFAAPKEWEY